MHRLRRKNEYSLGWPVAAEVFESRSLLSAGAAAVHAATQHAASLHPAQHQVTHLSSLPFQGTVVASQTHNGLTNYPPFNLSIASFSWTTGANVSVNFKHSLKFGSFVNHSITGTFKGKITAVNPLGQGVFEFDVQVTGSVTFAYDGKTFTAAPDGTPMKLYYGGGYFQELQVNVVFPPGTGDGLANAHYSYDLTQHEV
jgi:hypothetical protein